MELLRATYVCVREKSTR